MTIIDDFITHYKKEFDFYETVSKLVAQQLETALQSAGIRAIVTYRAKNPERLHAKLLQRSLKHNYATLEDIYNDICDLSGVRVALYFPSDRDNVESMIKENFHLLEDTKIFPDKSKEPNYNKRFSGYWARHYRISFKEKFLPESQFRYLNAKTEIQVASVLMHAWSEVEHDLVYKPLSGNLSEEEYAILDELNGLVLAGEIALERLNAAGNNRIKNVPSFNNQYELASYLYTKYQKKLDETPNLKLGNIELLYKLMMDCNIKTSSELNNYTKGCSFTKNTTSISDEIIDNIISGDSQRYEIYSNLKSSSTNNPIDLNASIGAFINQWIILEQIIYQLSQDGRYKSQIRMNLNKLKPILSPTDILLLTNLRKMRNMIVHGIETPNITDINKLLEEVRMICNKITSSEEYKKLVSAEE